MTQTRQHGFTLIELLIVIGLLGILATGLLAAVDPFEQLKKGRDTNMRNTVVEFHNALIRYYATHGDLPWNDSSSNCNANFSGDITSTGSETVETLGAADCIADLEDDGELKEGFLEALGDNAEKITVTSNSGVSVSVCFVPESKSIYNDDASKFDEDGDIDNATCGPAATKDVEDQLCYWCAK